MGVGFWGKLLYTRLLNISLCVCVRVCLKREGDWLVIDSSEKLEREINGRQLTKKALKFPSGWLNFRLTFYSKLLISIFL